MDPFTIMAVFASFVLACYGVLHRRPLRPLPPGPKGLPIVGNLFNCPLERPWLDYTEWRATYGGIMSFKVLGQPIVILNSARIASELLDKRSLTYSERPSFYMVKDLMKWDWAITFREYTDEWRARRKLFHQYLQPKALANYYPNQQSTTIVFLRKMIEDSRNFSNHVRYHAGTIVLRVTYGYESHETDDPYIELAEEAMSYLLYPMIPGSYLVDFLPLLRYVPRWFPFTGFKWFAVEGAKLGLNLRDMPYREVLQSMKEGRALPSMAATSLEEIESKGPKSDFKAEVVRDAAGTAFAAGSDTTVTLILTAMLAMLVHPELQRRAHKELDGVVGRHRLPNFEDRAWLPFIQAILWECLRWRPPTPLGVAQSNASDDIYDGYVIPAGSIIFMNTWAMMHDQDVYADPSAFNPDRFMGDNPEPSPDTTGCFGFGRRICLGRYLALDSAYITIVSILWAFNLTHALGEDQKELDVDVMAYDGKLVSHPLLFQCKIKPRFVEAGDIIKAAEMA